MEHVVLSEARPAPSKPASQAGNPVGRNPQERPVIVVVASQPAHREALRAVLGRHYRLREYASGEQAWAQLQVDGDVAAMVCSNSLPRMSGSDLLARLGRARLPALRAIPACLVADTIDDALRSRLGRQPVEYLGAFDRPLVDLAAWLKERLATGHPADRRRMRSDALRRWAHQHAGLDPKLRQSLVIFRVFSEGVGELSQRLARTIRGPEMMLAEALNRVWLCVDVPISSSLRFTLRLALGCVQDSDRDQVRLSVSYAPLLQLADETYDVLQLLAGEEPPLKHLLIATHHWRFVMPFEAARLLVK